MFVPDSPTDVYNYCSEYQFVSEIGSDTTPNSMKLQPSPKVKLIKWLFIALPVAVLLYFLYLVTPLILNQDSGAIIFGNDLPIRNPDTFVTVLNINDGNDGEKIVELTAILVPENSQPDKKLVCVDGILISGLIDTQSQEENRLWDIDKKISPSSNKPTYIIPDESQRPVAAGGFLLSSFSDICTQDSPQAISIYELNSHGLWNISTNGTISSPGFISTVTTITPIFFYPFDRYKIQLNAWLQSQGENIKTDIIGEVHSSNWEIASVINKNKLSKEPTLQIIYSRPLLLRSLVVILLVSLMLVIIFTAFIRDTTTYIGTLLGILLGMDGLRPILKSPDTTGTTMIDVFFLSFYILLGTTFIMRSALFPLWNFVNREQIKSIRPKLRRKKMNPN